MFMVTARSRASWHMVEKAEWPWTSVISSRIKMLRRRGSEHRYEGKVFYITLWIDGCVVNV